MFVYICFCTKTLLFSVSVSFLFLDETKFGQKLMEKMGWSKGKGLGSKEDGKTEHVSVSLKNDTKGRDWKLIVSNHFRSSSSWKIVYICDIFCLANLVIFTFRKQTNT